MKVYLAAKFGEREQVEQRSYDLPKGWECTARWVYGGEDGLSREAIAELDLEDIRKADALVLFTHERGSLQSGGGRFVEFGYALALGKKCIFIGPEENVFMHTPGVIQYNSWEDFKQAVA